MDDLSVPVSIKSSSKDVSNIFFSKLLEGAEERWK